MGNREAGRQREKEGKLKTAGHQENAVNTNTNRPKSHSYRLQKSGRINKKKKKLRKNRLRVSGEMPTNHPSIPGEFSLTPPAEFHHPAPNGWPSFRTVRIN